MAYQNNIPQPTDKLSKSQQDILNNFAALNPFGNNAAVFPTLGSAPTTAATEVALYNKASAYSNASSTQALYVRRLSSGTEIEWTSSSNVNGSVSQPGWTILPSGILLKWGTVLTDGSGLSTINTLGTNQPAFNTLMPFCTFLTYANSNDTVTLAVPRVQQTGVNTVRIFATAAKNINYFMVGSIL